MTTVDLNKIGVLTDTTYFADPDTWRSYHGNFYESPFNNQAAYGQRYHSKNFAKSEAPEQAQDYYEQRAPVGADLGQIGSEFLGDELPYHHQFPKYTNTKETTTEKFFTRPFASPQYHSSDVYSTALPATGPEIPSVVETFKIGEKEISAPTAIAIVICVIAIFLCFAYLVKNYPNIKTEGGYYYEGGYDDDDYYYEYYDY